MSPSRQGFTLVEMAFAIAILAFAMVTLIGLLAVGLSSQKSSTEDTRIAAMVGYVVSTERMKSFSTVSAAGYSTNYYFDLLGNTNAPAASYLKCTVSNVTAASNNSAILGIGGGLTNVAPMQAVFIYPLPAGVKTNVFYYTRSSN